MGHYSLGPVILFDPTFPPQGTGQHTCSVNWPIALVNSNLSAGRGGHCGGAYTGFSKPR